MKVLQVAHELHTFTFADLDHAAEYLVSIPKYALPTTLSANPFALANELRNFVAEDSVTMTSTITYVIARSMGDPQ